MSFDDIPETSFIWLGVGGFVFVWWLVLSIIARVSGWNALEEVYGSGAEIDGEKRRFQSIRMGPGGMQLASFGGVITFTASFSGLQIETFFPFNMTMRRFVVPFSDITARPAMAMLGFRFVELRFARAPTIGVQVSEQLIAWIREKSGGSLQLSAS